MLLFMQRLLALFLFVAMLVPAHAAPLTGDEQESRSASCGTERILVKTETDSDAPFIHIQPLPVTVDQLRAVPVPANYDKFAETRYEPERQTYSVRARLVGFKVESDRDFHIVIADLNSGKTMIVEPPDPDCPLSQKSGIAPHTQGVRALMTYCFGQPGRSFRKIPGNVIGTFTGVAYFDPIHGQTDVSPNGIELHPLIRLQLDSVCKRNGHAL